MTYSRCMALYWAGRNAPRCSPTLADERRSSGPGKKEKQILHITLRPQARSHACGS